MIKRLLKKSKLIQRMALRHRLAATCPVLLYHSVEDLTSVKHPFLSGNIHNVSPEVFHDQLSESQKSFEFIPIDELMETYQKKKSLKKLAAVTFDDGYASNITKALPVLEDLKIHGTLYLTGNLVKEQSFWRDRIRLLESRGLVRDFLDFAQSETEEFDKFTVENFYWSTKHPEIANSKTVDEQIMRFLKTKHIDIASGGDEIYCSVDMLSKTHSDYLSIGNHTMSHYVLSTLNKEEQYAEINDCQELLNTLPQPKSQLFSIPFGGRDTIDRDTYEVIEDLGFKGYLYSNGYKVSDSIVQDNYGQLPAFTRFMPRSWDQF